MTSEKPVNGYHTLGRTREIYFFVGLTLDINYRLGTIAILLPEK